MTSQSTMFPALLLNVQIGGNLSLHPQGGSRSLFHGRTWIQTSGWMHLLFGYRHYGQTVMGGMAASGWWKSKGRNIGWAESVVLKLAVLWASVMEHCVSDLWQKSYDTRVVSTDLNLAVDQ